MADQSTLTVVLVSADLMIASRLEGVARMARADFKALRKTAEIDTLLQSETGGGERALIVLDLASLELTGANATDLRAVVVAAHQAHCPVLAFGPHVQESKLDAARRAGCHRVVTRGAITGELRAAIVRHGSA